MGAERPVKPVPPDALAFLQIAAALRAGDSRGRVARAAKSAVDVGAGFGGVDGFFVADNLLIRRALEFDIIGLGRAAILACLPRTFIPAVAVWAHPFEFDEFSVFAVIHLLLLDQP